MGWYLTVIGKSLEFTGRASRAEYWNFWLVSSLIAFAFAGLRDGAAMLGHETLHHFLQSMVGFYKWAVWLPGLSAGARRMHDTGRSGWWQFVPVVGQIMLFFDGEHHENAYGADPNEELIESRPAIPKIR